jgi:hypothetical protein
VIESFQIKGGKQTMNDMIKTAAMVAVVMLHACLVLSALVKSVIAVMYRKKAFGRYPDPGVYQTTDQLREIELYGMLIRFLGLYVFFSFAVCLVAEKLLHGTAESSVIFVAVGTASVIGLAAFVTKEALLPKAISVFPESDDIARAKNIYYETYKVGILVPGHVYELSGTAAAYELLKDPLKEKPVAEVRASRRFVASKGIHSVTLDYDFGSSGNPDINETTKDRADDDMGYRYRIETAAKRTSKLLLCSWRNRGATSVCAENGNVVLVDLTRAEEKKKEEL